MTVTAYFHFESETPKNNFQKYHETFQSAQKTLSVTYVNHCSLQTIVSVIGTVMLYQVFTGFFKFLNNFHLNVLIKLGLIRLQPAKYCKIKPFCD